jgi:hypothetical protein
MEPGRFDDVEFRIVEEPADPPAPRRPGRRGHMLLAGTAAALLTGALAAGASALTSTAEAPTRAAARAGSSHVAGHGYARMKRDGICREGEGHRGSYSRTTAATAPPD